MNDDTDINKLIATSLCAARASIEDHGTCAFRILIVHPEGVQVLIQRAAPSNRAEEEGLNRHINGLIVALNGQMVIFVSDQCIAEDTNNHLALSYTARFPGAPKAIVVEIYGFEGILKCGMQKYRHCPDGQVRFEEFVWGALPPNGNHSDGPADPSKEN